MVILRAALLVLLLCALGWGFVIFMFWLGMQMVEPITDFVHGMIYR